MCVVIISMCCVLLTLYCILVAYSVLKSIVLARESFNGAIMKSILSLLSPWHDIQLYSLTAACGGAGILCISGGTLWGGGGGACVGGGGGGLLITTLLGGGGGGRVCGGLSGLCGGAPRGDGSVWCLGGGGVASNESCDWWNIGAPLYSSLWFGNNGICPATNMTVSIDDCTKLYKKPNMTVNEVRSKSGKRRVLVVALFKTPE